MAELKLSQKIRSMDVKDCVTLVIFAVYLYLYLYPYLSILSVGFESIISIFLTNGIEQAQCICNVSSYAMNTF